MVTSVMAGTSATPSRWVGILAGAIGNVLEWYDFAAYGYFAAIFGRNFFPNSNPVVSLLSAFAVFAAAFFMRPIGGAIFGHIGDRFGRRRALLISAGLMTGSTFLIGCLPTYASVGVLAPMLLVALRLIQGMSVGGEFSASSIFLVEASPPGRRGLSGSLASFGATSGTLLGSVIGAGVASLLTPAEILVWGWRVPFLLGILLGGFAWWLRRTRTAETAVAPSAHHAMPLVDALRNDGPAMLRGFLLSVSLLGSFYILFVYIVTFFQQVDGLSGARAFAINTATMVVMLMLIPIFGWLSDRVGRRAILVAALVALILLTWPLFRLLSSHHVELKILAGEFGFLVIMAAYGAVLPATLAELFSARTRCPAMSVSYNLGGALAGGTAPIIAAALVDPHARHPMGPAVYLIILAVISLSAAVSMKDRTGQPLRP